MYELKNNEICFSVWEKFVQEQIIKWRDTNLDWFFNFTKPTMILFYDQLISDLESNLRRLLKFLEVNVTESQLQCAIQRKEGIYKRKKKMMGVEVGKAIGRKKNYYYYCY